jgi:hypothetical protein
MNLPDFLTRDPEGEIHLTGRRIGLYSIVRCRNESYSAERIAEEFDLPSVEVVRHVLAFAEENRTEVDAYVEAYRQELDRQAATLRQGPSAEELRRRWQAMGLGPHP